MPAVGRERTIRRRPRRSLQGAPTRFLPTTGGYHCLGTLASGDSTTSAAASIRGRAAGLQ